LAAPAGLPEGASTTTCIAPGELARESLAIPNARFPRSRSDTKFPFAEQGLKRSFSDIENRTGMSPFSDWGLAMMDDVDAVEFAGIWEAAWNRRDVEAVLAHFAEDAVFTSPVAQQVGFARDGVVRGKDALRQYWLSALEKNLDLRFRVTAVYRGVDTIAIAFQNQHGVDRLEILRFAGGLVVEGHGAFIAS
jgi:hypothetical protein